MKKGLLIVLLGVGSLLVGCNDEGVAPTGKACLGANNDSLIEGLGGICQKGDVIATKNPAYFCDFKSAVTYNSYNSAICIYTGRQAEERAGVQAENTTEKSK